MLVYNHESHGSNIVGDMRPNTRILLSLEDNDDDHNNDLKQDVRKTVETPIVEGNVKIEKAERTIFYHQSVDSSLIKNVMEWREPTR